MSDGSSKNIDRNIRLLSSDKSVLLFLTITSQQTLNMSSRSGRQIVESYRRSASNSISRLSAGNFSGRII